MSLSKSTYCNGLQCKKMIWLLKNKLYEKGEDSSDYIKEKGIEVHDVGKNYFGDHIEIEYNDDLQKMVDETKKLLKNNNLVITEASFIYNNNFCSIDILKKENDKYEIYEIKGTNKLKDIHIDDVSFQYFVLKNLGLKVTKCSLLLINSDYKRKGSLELKKLFKEIDITKEVKEKQREVKNNIDSINNCLYEAEPNIDLGEYCFLPYACPFFNYCTKKLPEKNVFKIRKLKKDIKLKLYKDKVYSFEDALNSDIDDYYKIQLNHEINDLDDQIDKEKIKEFMDTLSYPLYFLDFETFSSTIPLYDDSKPNEQIPFQYSLHYIEKINGELKHKEFLSESGIDPRRKLAEQLVKDIPLNVCTLAYNMKFEKSVIHNLAEIYPDLEEHLMNIYYNIKDLMIPFEKRYYYNKDMDGSYSIKYVLPALFKDDDRLNYHNLDLIQNGVDAMTSFKDLENKSEKEQEYIRERLLRYCELDTYAMVKIYEKLKDII